MKLKIGVAAAIALLVLAQILYTVKTRREAAAARAAAEALAAISLPPRPAPAEVSEILLETPDGQVPVHLVRSGAAWTIKSLHDAPASRARVERFLTQLLQGGAELAAPAGGEAFPAAGLGQGEGLTVRLKRLDGTELPGLVLGLRPENAYGAAYVRAANDARIFLLAADLRGDAGLWRNSPDAAPDSRAWLDERVFLFEPETVVALDALYPDHQILFDREENGGWRFFGAAPNGKWRSEGVDEWLADLAGFRIADAADPALRAALGLDNPTHRLTLTLADGSQKALSLAPDHAGEGMWLESSDQPGRIYYLPEWRFRLYFQRLRSLFPGAAPSFRPEDVRFIDFRRGGEGIKLARRDGEWRAVAQTLPVAPGKAERLIRLMADWRPEDYASIGDKAARPAGGPLLEITLAGDDVLQYRLGGRHPVFPWRYVLVNGAILFSVAEGEAGVMFPELSEILIAPLSPDDEPETEPAREKTGEKPEEPRTGERETPESAPQP